VLWSVEASSLAASSTACVVASSQELDIWPFEALALVHISSFAGLTGWRLKPALWQRSAIQTLDPGTTPHFNTKVQTSKSRKNNGHSDRSMFVKRRRLGMSKKNVSFSHAVMVTVKG
jgi:hypothetical protein